MHYEQQDESTGAYGTEPLSFREQAVTGVGVGLAAAFVLFGIVNAISMQLAQIL